MVHLLVRFDLGVLRAPRHGAEADFGHGNIRAAKFPVFHLKALKVI
jgi:hypothetical protein